MNEKPVIRHNEAKNGIEVVFVKRPSDEILDWLRAENFRWSNYNKVWYAPYEPDKWDLVNSYFNVENPKPEVSEARKAEIKNDNAATAYIKRIKNRDKKKYAQEYQEWIKAGRDENKEPEYRGKSYMAGDEVRRTLRKYYPLPEAQLKPAPTLESVARKYGMTILDLRPRLATGINIEFEHTKDTKTAETIALQHLDENPRYYSDPKPENWAEKELEKESKPIATGNKPYNLEKLVEDYKKQLSDWAKNRLIEDFAYALSGDDNKKRRQALMTTLKGYKVTIAMSGIHNLMDALNMYVKNRVKEDKEVKAVAITLSTDEAAKLFEHYGLNEKQSLLMYELGIHSKDYAVSKMPEEIVKPLIENGYIHGDTYKFTGMSVLTDLGRTMFNMAAQRNIDEYMEKQKSPKPEPEDDDMTDTEKVTEEINEMFEGATTAEVTLGPKKPQMTKVELMRQHIWDEIPSYVKYAEPVKPVKFGRDPEDGILPKFLEPFTETDPSGLSLRPVMAGIYFDDGHIVATDAHKLIHLVTDSKAEGNYCITPTCLKRVEKKDRTKDGRQIDPSVYPFPKWRTILPYDNKYHYKLDLLKLKTFAQICMRARIVPEAAPGCEFIFEDKEERLALSGAYLSSACDALMKLGHKEASMYFSDVTRAVYLMPVDAKQDTVENIVKSDFVLIMPMILNYGSSDTKERYLRYNLLTEKVINLDGSIAEIDTSITKSDITLPIPDYLFSIMRQKAKKTTLTVIAFALVKNNILTFTDLYLDIQVANVNLPDGFYQFFGDTLLPQEFEEPNEETGNFAKEEDYPVIFARPKDLIYSFNDSRFIDVIAEAGDYVAKDELRPVMNAIHLIYDEKSRLLRAFASDAHFMFVANILPEIASPDLKHELNLGGQSNVISQIFKKHKFQDYKVDIYYASRNTKDNYNPERVSIKFDNITITARTEEFNPPKFLGVLPDVPYTKALTINKAAFKKQFEEKKKDNKRDFAVIIEPTEVRELSFGYLYQGIYTFCQFEGSAIKTNLPFHQITDDKDNIIIWTAEGKNIVYIATNRWKVNGQWSTIDDESFAIKNIKPVLPEVTETIPEVTEEKPKVDKSVAPAVDMNGNRILTAEEWNNLPTNKQDELRKTITAPVTDLQGNTFNVDKGLAPYLQRILNLGLATGQSDSGMVGDHPNYRHVETGELLYPKTGGTGAYLTFWKPEAKQVEETGRKINNQTQIDAIRKVAKESGLIAYDGLVFSQPSLGINFPQTNDGTWRQDILKEANELLNKEHPEFGVTGNNHPSGERFMEWLDLRNDVYEAKILAKHGGVHFYTDEEIAGLWEKFVSGLEKEIPKVQVKPVKSTYKSKYEYFTKENAPDNIKDRFGISKTDDRQIIEGVPKTFLEKLKDGEQVFSVDGKYIRDNIYSDFGQGGNDMAYPEFVPIGEIWIEKDLIAEKDQIMTHELRERNLMVGQGMPDQKKALTYNEAHEIAKTMEDSERGTKPETLSYEKFSKQYKELFNLMMKYSPKEAGSQIYAEKMALLSDKYPEYVKRIEEEKESESEKWVTYYTNAPESYDGFGTGTDLITEYVDNHGKPVRKIHIAVSAIDWQKGRNNSGNYATLNEKEFQENKDIWFKKAEPVKSVLGKSQILDVFLPKIKILKPFISQSQLDALVRLYRSEEREGAIEIATRLAGIIESMPKTYETDDIKAEDKIIHLHYFYGGSDWYIAEKDKNPDQNQMFGYAILNGDFEMAEWGYISAIELKENNIELDFYFEPQKFSEIHKLEVSDVHKDEEKDEGYGTGTQFEGIGEPKTDEMSPLDDWVKYIDKYDGKTKYKRKFQFADLQSVYDFFAVVKHLGVVTPLNESDKSFAIITGDYIHTGNKISKMFIDFTTRHSKKEPEVKTSDIDKFEVGDRVSYTTEKFGKTITGTIIEVSEYDTYKVKFSETIPGLFNKPVQAMSGKMLKLMSKAKESEANLMRLENADKDQPDLRIDLSKLQPVKTQMDAVYLVNLYKNRYTTIQGNFDKFIARHNELNSDLLFNPDNSKYYIASGKFIFELEKNPSQLEYYQKIGVQVSKSEPEKEVKPVIASVKKYKSDTVRDAFDFVRKVQTYGYQVQFSDGKMWFGNAVDKEEAKSKAIAEIYGEKGVKKEPKSSFIASDYKGAYELNKAIEKLLDQKWNDKPESWSTEELTFIKYYSGYGGLEEGEGKGTLYEFYTPDKVIEKMWGLAYKHGYKEGRMLEPSVGVGEFLKRQYVKSMVIKDAYEVNKYSARICKLLYPEVNVNDGKETKFFEELFIKDRYTVRDKVLPIYELVIGNPPYGKAGGVFMGMGEEGYTNAHNYIDYFIFRGLDLLVPNGLLVYIIGAEVAAGGKPWLDQGSSKCKDAIAKKGKLIDAYRLPEGVFERTQVVSDIIVMKKRS